MKLQNRRSKKLTLKICVQKVPLAFEIPYINIITILVSNYEFFCPLFLQFAKKFAKYDVMFFSCQRLAFPVREIRFCLV